MIKTLPITLVQGLALHSACVEVSKIEFDGFERRDISQSFERVDGQLKEMKVSLEQDAVTKVVTGLRFKADVWVNENTHAQGKPAFALLDKEEKDVIEIDFEKYPQIADHFDNGFGPEVSADQKLEATCEKFIRDILVDSLKA